MRLALWTRAVVVLAGIDLISAQAWLINSLRDLPIEGGFGVGQRDLNDIPCPDYTAYARHRHHPFSDGPLKLPYQRPDERCRRFRASEVEAVIEDLYAHIKDRDLAQIFRNAFPNTLDTTVLWHVDGKDNQTKSSSSNPWRYKKNTMRWDGPQSFVVTGDINAEWLRDSTNQLAQYQVLAKTSPAISDLIRGAIATQAEFVIESPYCNAFQPPPPSGLDPSNNGQDDSVHPAYEPAVVFECKYELDSLANFLSLSNQFHKATGSTSFVNARWFLALQTLWDVLEAQSRPTFDAQTAAYSRNEYTFQRSTNVGTETLNLRGIGNPLGNGTGLVRSAFRPSDDATIFGFFIPANAMMSVELARTAKILEQYTSANTNIQSLSEGQVAQLQKSAAKLRKRSKRIRDGIMEHAVITHPVWGRVFAYEIDGYGSHLLMDDANIPSLLALPLLGFVDVEDEIYQNTRKMILSSHGNPYFLQGPMFSGIGGPHVGPTHAWPMSVLVQAMTSVDDEEILECLARVKNVSVFGLINESVNVRAGPGFDGSGMTRSWFAWANSVFAQTILWLAETKPELLFEQEKGAYKIGSGFV